MNWPSGQCQGQNKGGRNGKTRGTAGNYKLDLPFKRFEYRTQLLNYLLPVFVNASSDVTQLQVRTVGVEASTELPWASGLYFVLINLRLLFENLEKGPEMKQVLISLNLISFI